MALLLTSDQHDRMIAHALAEAPREACGLITGCGESAGRIHPLPNIETDPNRYLVDPEAQIRVLKEARERDEELVAIYHSHPRSPAYPSPTDIEWAFYPEAIYVIVSLAERTPRMRAFTIRGGQVREVVIQVEDRSEGGMAWRN